MKNNNRFRVWLTTSVVIALCICTAVAVTMLVGCKKSEYSSDVPSPEYVDTGDAAEDGKSTDFYLGNFDEVPEITENEITDTTEETEEYTETETEEETEVQPSGSGYDGSWNLLLVNPWNPLPEDFEVEFVNLNGGHKVDSRAYEDLQAMMDDCRAAGLSPYICSSYRTYDYQKGLHERQINKYLSYGYSYEEAYAEASKWVAVPGTSEHQTGLALDIVASYYVVLDESQEDMPEQKWLMEHSYKYGWVLRYPNDKTDVTGIYYEPWHYRYVGKEVAKEIHDRGICLEEYLNKTEGLG